MVHQNSTVNLEVILLSWNRWNNTTLGVKKFLPIEFLQEKIKFAHPQSGLIVLGNTRGYPEFQEQLNNLFVKQFKFILYIVYDYKENYFIQSLLRSSWALHKITGRAIIDGSIDSRTLIDLFQVNPRLIISVKELSTSFRIKYWQLLNTQIRKFFVEGHVESIPHAFVWLDKSLFVEDIETFEHFRLLNLWGDDYGLRFGLSLESYVNLSYPARTLFNIFILFPGVKSQEVKELIDNLDTDRKMKSYLYQQYYQLKPHQALVVSRLKMFDPFILDIQIP